MSGDAEALLSPQETEALLEAMRAGTVPGGGERSPAAAVAADAVELGDPERVLRRAQPLVDKRIPSLALPLRRAFMRHTESGVEVTEMPSEIQPWSVVVDAIEGGVAVARVRTEAGAEGLLTVGAPLVAYVVERRMGAPLKEPKPGEEPGGSAAVEPGAGLSEVDQRVLRPFVRDLLVELSAAFHRGRGALRFGGFVLHAGDLPQLDRYEPVLRIPVRFAPTGMAHEEVALSLSAAAVVELEPPGAAAPAARPRRRPKPKIRARIRRTLLGAEVDVAVVLGELPTTVEELLRWKEGDVLRLDTVVGRPLSVRAEGRELHRGEPTVRGGNLAVRLVEPTREQEQPEEGAAGAAGRDRNEDDEESHERVAAAE